jgi:hypothetical protein
VSDKLITVKLMHRTGAVCANEGFKFTKSKGFGAVLVTQGDVKEEYYSDDTSFHRWIDDNFKELGANYPDLVQHNVPLWIITKIYYAQECSIWCWEGEQKVVSLEFGVKTVPGEGDGTGSYSASSVTTTGPGWTHYGDPNLSSGTVFILYETRLMNRPRPRKMILFCLWGD